METITARDGEIYYGTHRCKNASEAYKLFRKDYNDSVGKSVYLTLARLGQRKERIHGFGFEWEEGSEPVWEEPFGYKRVSYRILGLSGIHYWRSVGSDDFPDLDEETLWRWFFWAFTDVRVALKYSGTRKKRKKRKHKNNK